MDSIAAVLFRLRWELCYSQEILARMLGISQARLSVYERGEVTPTWDVLARMLERIQLRPRIILEDTWEETGSDLREAAPVLADLTNGYDWAATGELAARLLEHAEQAADLTVLLAAPGRDLQRLHENLSGSQAFVWDRENGPLGQRYRVVYHPAEFVDLIGLDNTLHCRLTRWTTAGDDYRRWGVRLRLVDRLPSSLVLVEHLGARWPVVPPAGGLS
ncbi:MAG: helix-turn-helix domain-containing protein [Nocardioidaceae bacterium]